MLDTTTTCELFYVYAREDEALRKRLDVHLAVLKREGLLSTWHDRQILAGALWEQEIDQHLQDADIILLLISPDFLASDYCYGVELQRALARHAAGETVLIPILLRPSDWQQSPFARLQALPRNGKPVVEWTNRDKVFSEIAQEIRLRLYELTGRSPEPLSSHEKRTLFQTEKAVKVEKDTMISTPAGLTSGVLNRAIARYHKELKSYTGFATHELALRSAFQNLLAETARAVNLTLIPEQTIEGRIRPDGVVRDTFFRRGIWEAKGPEADLELEVRKKQADGYPLENALFENTRTAILYQGRKRYPVVFDLSKASDLRDLLHAFLTYTEPEIATFENAVQEFRTRIPELAGDLLTLIDKEYKQNRAFIAALETFSELCRKALNPRISSSEIREMLVQHLLTERLFRTIFNNSDFVNRNVIAIEIEKVIQALISTSFDRREFLKGLDRFYVVIEAAAKGIESWAERQHFLNTVYERFFQGFSVKQADTHGIVYTPQEIVDFMVASVDEVLQREFGQSLATPGVKILDPAVGTGNFIVNIISHIAKVSRSALREKYAHDLFCNEIMLLPYYIASLNIEHEYYDRMGSYVPFEGICFADTLELAESQQLSFFNEKNSVRVEREKAADIMVVIGNPPYNVGQVSENDNNKNRKYTLIDQRIRETYSKASKATNKNALSDAYVKFFRWATDRLQGHDGVVCLVTNNSFVDQIAFDGMRAHLMQEFTAIYHIDLHGNVRKNPKLSGTTHNVFGIQVGVGITIAVRSAKHTERILHYYRVPEDWRKNEKYDFLREKQNIYNTEWLALKPDTRHIWITEGLNADFLTFTPMGMQDLRGTRHSNPQTIFRSHSGGVKTNRDTWVYDFEQTSLERKVKAFIEAYRADIDRWRRREDRTISVDSFVTSDETRIKWSDDLKVQLEKGTETRFKSKNIRNSLYRPFTKKLLYFDAFLNNRIYLQHLYFPTPNSETENAVIIVASPGADHQTVLAANILVDLKCGISGNSGNQCFPYYTYAEDGSNRRENITDWALEQFQGQYGSQVSKWDIFHYVYAMLHHPQYRERYAENLKHDLPHIPLLSRPEAFQSAVSLGQQLMNLHLNYEQATPYGLRENTTDDSIPFEQTLRVERMRLTPDRSALIVNPALTLEGIPEACFSYRLGNRSALEWVIDQYQVTRDARSGIESDPNRLDDPEYIIRLVKQVVQVSVQTVALVEQLARSVTLEDWLVTA